MRIRSIKPELWTDLRTGEWNAEAALFFVGLWMVADDAGRLRLEPRLIAAALDPFEAKFGGARGIGDLLDQLIADGRVLAYEVAGERFGLVANFARHQVINKPSRSRLPDPPPCLRDASGSPPVGLPGVPGTEVGAGSLEQEQEYLQPGEPAARPGARRAPKASDPRLKPLEAQLVAAFAEVRRGAKYPHGRAKDTEALKRLLLLGEPTEIVRRWRLGLEVTGFHRVDSIAQLAMPEKWNHFQADGSVRPAGRVFERFNEDGSAVYRKGAAP